MKVLHVVWSAHFAGAEKLVLRVSDEMVVKGLVDSVAVVLIEVQQVETAGENALSTVPGDYRVSKLYKSSRNLLNFISTISHAIKDFGPDVIHSHDYRATIATRISLSLLFGRKPKHVATIHDAYPFMKRINLRSLIAFIALTLPNEVTVVSESVRDQMWFRKLLSKKIKVIPNPYLGIRKLEDLRSTNLDKVMHSKEYDFVFVGRLVPKKHPEIFCEVCSRLGAKCVVVGDGELRTQLEREYGSRVTFLGFRKDVEDIMLRSRFLFLPSEYEGFGLVLIEAMANFCIPVVTPWTGVEKIIEHGKTGYIVHWSIESMTQELSKLLYEYSTTAKNVLENFPHYLKNFSLDSYVLKIAKIYETVNGNRSERR
uniref:Glycosyltransferase n=1 Tax=Fervidobacterium pennivorans TaxID=93466 RepID=A0A7V4KE57_FERPE